MATDLIIEQPAIAGTPATSDAQIRDFFVGNGWKPFTSDGETAFFDEENGLAISDTHRGNLILTLFSCLVACLRP